MVLCGFGLVRLGLGFGFNYKKIVKPTQIMKLIWFLVLGLVGLDDIWTLNWDSKFRLRAGGQTTTND